MYLSDSDSKLILKYISNGHSHDLNIKSVLELLNNCVDRMTDEEAKEILRVSKKYPENEDIDECRSINVVKVIARYFGRFCGIVHSFQYPYSNGAKNYDYYNSKIKYCSSIVEELSSEEFTFSKVRAMLACEKIFMDYQELSECQGLTEVNEYIRNNIYDIIVKRMQLSISDDIRKRGYCLQIGTLNNKKRSRGR